MKKVLAILVVLALVAGFAFAADDVKTNANGTATINVTTEVKDTFPRFGITAKTIAAAAGSAGTPDATITANGAVTITTNYLTSNGVEIGFTINQIANSRCTAGYKLKVRATDLVLNGYASVGTSAIDNDEKFTVSKTADFTATGAIDDVRTVTAVNSASTEGYTGFDGGFTVGYLAGKFIDVAADSAAKKELGTVSYTWAKNESAVVGSYAATVELTILAD